MIYNTFGSTQLKVSDVGFGAWAIGGMGWSAGPDDDAARGALKAALDAGVTLYDTCDSYGNGRSEILVGEMLKDVRKDVVIVTKGGTNWRIPERSKNFSHDYLMMCLDESLERLQTDYVDVYLLHVPSAQMQDDEKVFDTMKEMKQSGKARFVGLAMWQAADTLHALEKDTDGTIEALEVPFNILNKSNPEVVKIAKERNIGVLTSQPLASGILTGKYGKDTVFDKSDNRAGFWTKERFESVQKDLAIVQECCEKTGLTMTELALAYNMSYPGISCVIPGGKTAEQVNKNVASSGKRLSEEIMARLGQTEGFVF